MATTAFNVIPRRLMSMAINVIPRQPRFIWCHVCRLMTIAIIVWRRVHLIPSNVYLMPINVNQRFNVIQWCSTAIIDNFLKIFTYSAVISEQKWLKTTKSCHYIWLNTTVSKKVNMVSKKVVTFFYLVFHKKVDL